MAIVQTGKSIAPIAGARKQFLPARLGAFPVKILKAYDNPVKNQEAHPGGLNFVTEGVILGEGVEFRADTMFTGTNKAGYPRADVLKRIAASANLGPEFTGAGVEIDTDELATALIGAECAYAWFEERTFQGKDGRTMYGIQLQNFLTPAEYTDMVSRDAHTKPLSSGAQAVRDGNAAKKVSELSDDDVAF